MAFSWKVLLPFSIVQVIANAIIMSYGGADWILGLVSLALLVLLIALVSVQMRLKAGAGTTTIRREPARPRMITAQETSSAGASGD
jgi:hypothetical protein